MEFTFTFNPPVRLRRSRLLRPRYRGNPNLQPVLHGRGAGIAIRLRRAQAQARYCAKNKEQEQAKARERMHRLRDARREEAEYELKRKESSDRLRATPLFARYRVHAHTHLTPSFLHPVKLWMNIWRTFAGHARSSRIPEDQVAACLGDLRSHHFRLDFKYTDERAVASYDRCLQGAFDDDDIEFMLRHEVPTPTMESLSCCSHLM
ncbi:hypothetical protein B0H13DRAFT_2376436 [Mycena leptocephala]|nr:hypothetical protein B0H13DRAFT_2376436 [Mycena leptocephala]